MKHNFVVGDVLYSSWGYDQTNIDFYQVLKVTPSGVYIQRLLDETKSEPGEFMAGKCTPKRDESLKNTVAYLYDTRHPLIFKRVNPHGYVKIKSYARAGKWDGQPKRCSWYA